MLDALLDLVLPARCAACPAPARLLCSGCRPALATAPDLRVLPDGLVVALAGPYRGPVRSALLAHKERQRIGLAAPLGEALAVAVRVLDPGGPVLLVPVPSARDVVR
ncbi:MAG: ComF family protein, partial [Actinomycetota bacterium]|nr:ComF family protein [Actinomycetota bacterium]